MTVHDLLKVIINTAESLDQEVILFSEIDVVNGRFKGATEHSKLNVAINGECLQLFMKN